MIEFTVYGEPVAQGRPRFTTIGGHVKAYDPKKSREFKQYIRLVASENKPDKPLECEIEVEMDVYRSIPKSMPKYKREKALNGELRPTTKPDLDNVVKSIWDSLTGIIWRDDKQIVGMTVRKWYSEQPRIELKVKPLGGESR